MEPEEVRRKSRQIRLIALDIDGTSMNNKSEITAHTRAILQELVNRGYLVVPTTGRRFHNLREKIIGVAGIRYVISSNGAVVTDGDSGSRIYENLIPCETAAALAGDLLQDNCCLYLHQNDGKGTFAPACKSREVYEEYFAKPGWPSAEDILTSDLDRRIRHAGQDVIKLGLYFLPPKGFGVFENIMAEKYPNINFFRVGNNSLEFTNGGVNKAVGLRALCQHLQIPLEQVCAIGDNGNDVEMLRAAGIGVAMGNAIAEAKAAADFIAGDNDREGAADFFEKFFL